MSANIKFKKPHSTANGVVDIISNSLGLSGKVKIAFTTGLALKSEENVRQCMLNILKLLANDYKK